MKRKFHDSQAIRRTALLCELPFCFMLAFAPSAAFSAEPSSADTTSYGKIIVVAKLNAGEYLQAPAECSRPGIVCMDPPPFWFTACIVATVYGQPPPSTIRVTTNSHFGMKEYEHMEAPQLVLLRTNSDDFVMPKYAREPLISDKNGKLYLRTFEATTIDWLPCATGTLREEIYPANFNEEGLEIKADEFSNYHVMTNPAMYRMTGQGAWPRYAISVDRLRAYLEQAGPDLMLDCKSVQ